MSRCFIWFPLVDKENPINNINRFVLQESGKIVEGIVVDSAGNLYVTGYTSGNFYGNVNAGSSDVFLMKLNSSGIIQ